MYVEDTIAAISTPPGEGGVAVVRVSGPEATAVAARMVRKGKSGGFDSHRFYYGEAVDPDSGEVIDEVMAVLMRAPRSYTREDVLELQCHGGTLVARRLLEGVLRCGVRSAQPGEFTRRAFLNGRIDLAQAEAVIDVIRAGTDLSLSVAQRQREGKLSAQVAEARADLRHALALVEAFLDFPEDDLEGASLQEVLSRLASAAERVRLLLYGFEAGRLLREGAAVIIAGKPNVGKSSIMNALLREERSIVTAVPGTTRDYIEERLSLHGMPLRLLDTAGIRDTEDGVEAAGVELSLRKIADADLILFVVDRSQLPDHDDAAVAASLEGKPYLLVRNKSDLTAAWEGAGPFAPVGVLDLSAATGEGIEALRDRVFELFTHGEVNSSTLETLVTNVRHQQALNRAAVALEDAAASLQSGAPLELSAADLRGALAAVGEITGETTPDDILDIIFGSFCIGK